MKEIYILIFGNSRSLWLIVKLLFWPYNNMNDARDYQLSRFKARLHYFFNYFYCDFDIVEIKYEYQCQSLTWNLYDYCRLFITLIYIKLLSQFKDRVFIIFWVLPFWYFTAVLLKFLNFINKKILTQVNTWRNMAIPKCRLNLLSILFDYNLHIFWLNTYFTPINSLIHENIL